MVLLRCDRPHMTAESMRIASDSPCVDYGQADSSLQLSSSDNIVCLDPWVVVVVAVRPFDVPTASSQRPCCPRAPLVTEGLARRKTAPRAQGALAHTGPLLSSAPGPACVRGPAVVLPGRGPSLQLAPIMIRISAPGWRRQGGYSSHG